MRFKEKRTGKYRWIVIIFMILMITFFMMPLLVMIFDSFRSVKYMMQPGFDLSPQLTFRNYVAVFQNTSFIASVFNSLIVAVAVTGLTVFCGATAAYGFTRFKVFGLQGLSNAILICRMIPSVVLGIPLFIIGQKLGILHTYLMLVLAVATFALPFQIWMLLGFFAQIPRSLDESARIDGCSYYKTFWKIVAPAAAPGLAATTIMTFFFSWNELFFAIIMCDSRTKTAPLAVMDFLGYRNFDWGAILAGRRSAYDSHADIRVYI